MIRSLADRIGMEDIKESLRETWKLLDKEERGIFILLLKKLGDTTKGENTVELHFSEEMEFQEVEPLYEGETVNERVRGMLLNIVENSEIHYTDPEDSDHWIDCPLITGIHCERDTAMVVFRGPFAATIKDAIKDGWHPEELGKKAK